MEIPEVAQPPELGGDLHNVIVLLLLEGGHVDVGETESLQVTHLTQERSFLGFWPGYLRGHSHSFRTQEEGQVEATF